MRQNSQQALALLCGVVPGSQGRVQQALVPRDDAFDLPAMSIDPLGEAAFHHASVLGLRPATPGVPPVQRNRRAANAQLPAAQDMVAFAIVARVGQKPGQSQVTDCLPHGRSELRVVVAGSSHHQGSGDQVSRGVTDDRQLGPTATAEPFISLAIHKVCADVVALQTRGINGPLGLGGNQPAFGSTLENDGQEPVKSPFFISRCSA